MELMQIRRRLLMQETRPKWDYEFYPVDGSELGYIACHKIDVKPGDIITINYWTTKDNRTYSGYVYDGRNLTGISYLGNVPGGANNPVWNEDATLTLSFTSEGEFTIADHWRNGKDGISRNTNDSFWGRYIRVKIN